MNRIIQKCSDTYTYTFLGRRLPLEALHASLVSRLHHEHLRVSVHAGNQPQANSPSDSLRHLALVARSETCLPAVLDLAHLRHVFGHDAEVLVTDVSSVFVLTTSSLPLPLPLPLPPLRTFNHSLPCNDPSGSKSTDPTHPTSAAGFVLTSSTSTARLR